MAIATPRMGLLLPLHETVLWADGDVTILIDMARAAERAGFDSVWAGDSLLARARAEPLTLLSAIAAATAQVHLGTAVLLPLLRHPLSLAHAVATLDRICQGRLTLGVGPGAPVPGTAAELAALGAGSDHPVTAMLGNLDRCARLWRGEASGIELLPRPHQAGGPPLWIAGHGPRMVRIAGQRFDRWLPVSPTVGDYRSGPRAAHQAAEQAGRDPSTITASAYLTVAIADTPKQAAAELTAYLGATEVGVTAAATRLGSTDSAGPLLALWGVGSLAGGLADTRRGGGARTATGLALILASPPANRRLASRSWG